MKPYFNLIILLFFILSFTAFCDLKSDLQKICGAEEVLMETKMKNIVSYAYRTTLSFELLEKRLKGHFGKEWKFSPLSAEHKNLVKEKIEKSGQVFHGLSKINHVTSDKMITITVLQQNKDEKDFFVSVLVME